MTQPIWITEQDVVDLLDLREAIEALARGLRLEAAGGALNMAKTHVAWPHGTLHGLGAVFPERRVAAVKAWAHTEGGATPLLQLVDAHDGSLMAVIEAFALGQMRTGGISGLATDWLADPDARELAIIGTGKQALVQVAAVNAVRPLRRVRVFSPKAESRRAFVRAVESELEIAASDCDCVAEAVAGAPIITLVTRATAPFLDAAMVARGAHVNAVGAITPERAEFAQDIFARASRIAVDSLPGVQKLSREFTEQFGVAGSTWDRVVPLSRLIAQGQRRAPADDITLFKAMGMGISDLALAVEIHERAIRSGRGSAFAHPKRVRPRMRATKSTTEA